MMKGKRQRYPLLMLAAATSLAAMLGIAACGGDVIDAASDAVTLEVVLHEDGTLEQNVPDMDALERGAPVRMLVSVMGTTIIDETAPTLEEASVFLQQRLGVLNRDARLTLDMLREELSETLSEPDATGDYRKDVQLVFDLMDDLPSIQDLDAMTPAERKQAIAIVQARIRATRRELQLRERERK